MRIKQLAHHRSISSCGSCAQIEFPQPRKPAEEAFQRFRRCIGAVCEIEVLKIVVDCSSTCGTETGGVDELEPREVKGCEGWTFCEDKVEPGRWGDEIDGGVVREGGERKGISFRGRAGGEGAEEEEEGG